MSENECINIVLSFVNEKPFTVAPTSGQVPIYDLCKSITLEEVSKYNGTIGKLSNVTSIGSIPSSYQSYYVYRASRNAVARVLGFEDKAIEYALVEENNAMQLAIENIIDTKFNSDYNYVKDYIAQATMSVKSLEEAYRILNKLKEKIDSISVPTYIDESSIETNVLSDEDNVLYKLSVLKDDKDTLAYLNKKFSKAYLSTKTDVKYFHTYILSKITGNTFEEVQDEIDGIVESITALIDNVNGEGLSNEVAMARIMLSEGNALNQQEIIRQAKIVALDYLELKEDIGYFKNYILQLCINATSVEEVTNIVDSIEDTIGSITPPEIFSSEEQNRYKLAVLTNDTNTIQLLNKQYAMNYISTLMGYEYFRLYMSNKSKEVGTYEEVTSIINEIVNTIDSIIPPEELSIEDSNRYKLAILRLKDGTQDEDKLIASIVEYHLDAELSISDYQEFKPLILENVDKSTVDSIQKSISNAIAVIEKNFNTSRKYVLSYGWKFNTTSRTLVPNENGYITSPQSFLSIKADDGTNVSVRDWKLFNNDDNTFIFTDSIDVSIVEDILYDDLPITIKEYVRRHCLYHSYMSMTKNGAMTVALRNEMNEARINLIRDDANKIAGNFLENTSNTTLLDRESLV